MKSIKGETMIPERKRDRTENTGNPVPHITSGRHRDIPIVMYHRIVDDPALARRHWSYIHVDQFRRHLEALDSWGYTSITFDDYRLCQERGFELPRRPIIITFDDGYIETHTLAFPLLQEFGMRAVLFVLGDRKITRSYWDLDLGLPDVPLMSAHQILEMHAAGHEIGSHSMTHSRLPLLSEQDAWEEISRSRILLEILINAPVRSFAYPYGLLTPALHRMVESAGYSIGCGVFSGPPNFGVDLLDSRRTPVLSTYGPMALGIRLTAAYRWYAWSRWRLGRILGSSAAVARQPGMKFDNSKDVLTVLRGVHDQYEKGY